MTREQAGEQTGEQTGGMAGIRAMLAANPPTGGTFQERRGRWEEVYTRISPVPHGTVTAPTGAHGIDGEWVSGPGVSSNRERPIFYLHGGDFTAGTAPAYRGLAARLSAAAGRPVLTVDYRHAPEDPFPAALDDCVAAWRWLVHDQDAAPDRIVMVGDSAGGNLVVATMLRLRNEGEALPAAAVCISPVFDLALTGESVEARAERDPCILPESLRLCSAAYLGKGDPTNPLASPLYANLTGLPPLLLQFGSEEMLRDDSVRLGQKATAAGVDVSLEEAEGMIHVWHLFADRLPEARAAIERVGAFVETNAP